MSMKNVQVPLTIDGRPAGFAVLTPGASDELAELARMNPRDLSISVGTRRPSREGKLVVADLMVRTKALNPK